MFFGRDFISVTSAPGVSWGDLEPIVLETLLDHFVGGAPLFAQGTAAAFDDDAPAIKEDPEDADIIDQIKDLIETRVRPAVAQDGGDIVYRGYQGRPPVSRHAGSLLGLPLVDDHAQARHRKSHPALCPRSGIGRSDLILACRQATPVNTFAPGELRTEA